MSEHDYNMANTFGTIGMMLSFAPGKLIESSYEGLATVASGCINLVAYGFLAFGWMGYYEVGGWKLYLAAFMVGQSVALAKTACLSVTMRSLDSASDIGKGVGLLIGCLEYGNCLYTQVTEIWCAENGSGNGESTAGCDYNIPGKGAVAIRHFPTAVVAFILAPAIYRPGTISRAGDVHLTTHFVVLLCLIGMSMVNWNDGDEWCYNYATEWIVELSEGEFGTLYNTVMRCWLPFFQLAGWLVGLGTVSFFMFHVLTSSRNPCTPWISAEDIERIGKASSAKPRETRVSWRSEIWKFAIIVGITLGIGQAVGCSFYNISASFYKTSNTGYDSGGYLYSKMLGGMFAGVVWDLRPEGKSEGSHVIRLTKMLAWGMFASQAIFSLGTQENPIANYFVRHVGFALCGFSTGGMTTMVPLLANELANGGSSLSWYSWLMASAIVGQILFFNVIEGTDWKFNHSKSDGYLTYVSNMTDDDAPSDWAGCLVLSCLVNLYTAVMSFEILFPGWGECKGHFVCYKYSFYIQGVAGLMACGFAHNLKPQKERVPPRPEESALLADEVAQIF